MTLGALSRAVPALALLGMTGCTLDLDVLTAGTVGSGGSGGSVSSSTATTGGMAGMGGVGGMGGGGMGGEAGAGNMPSLDLRVQHAVQLPYLPLDNTLKPRIKIINESPSDIPLDQVTVRYWYTNENITQEQFNCDFSTPNVCAATSAVFTVVNPAVKNANRYMELRFMNSSVTLLASGGSVEIHTRAQATVAGDYDETNDYSYDATTTDTFQDSTVITAYVMGELAWGFEPQ
jgi:hypothetical protein